MTSRRYVLAAIAFAALSAASPALADQFLGSYVARIGQADHFASDGYRLDTVEQMVRQDRANYHKSGIQDPEDEYDPWFQTAQARARFEKLLYKSGMSGATRSAIANGEPLVEVKVYRNSVRVRIIGY